MEDHITINEGRKLYPLFIVLLSIAMIFLEIKKPRNIRGFF